MKKNKWTTEPYKFFLFKFDSCRVFDDDFFTYSELAKTRTSQITVDSTRVVNLGTTTKLC